MGWEGGEGVGDGPSQREQGAVRTWHSFLCNEHVRCICEQNKQGGKNGLLWLIWVFLPIFFLMCLHKKRQNQWAKPEQELERAGTPQFTPLSSPNLLPPQNSSRPFLLPGALLGFAAPESVTTNHT